MADENQRTSTFERLLEPVNNFAAGDRVSASKFNKMLRNQRKLGGVQPAVQVGPTVRASGQIDLGIVRGWAKSDDDFMDVSFVVRDPATGVKSIPSKNTVKVICQYGLQADAYEVFQWIGKGNEIYPLVIPRNIAVLALPIVSVGSDLMALFLPLFFARMKSNKSLPTTEGFNVDGQGEVGFSDTP